MYVYTDDDLTRINRDYLGPKGKRLPWVATYRTYGVSIAVLVFMFAGFMWIGLPLNQWTVLLYVFACVLTINFVVRRLKRDVSLWSMFKAGYQEVSVPRAAKPKPQEHPIRVEIARFDYSAQPTPTWWERHFKKAQTKQQTAGAQRPEFAVQPARGDDESQTRRARRRAETRKA